MEPEHSKTQNPNLISSQRLFWVYLAVLIVLMLISKFLDDGRYETMLAPIAWGVGIAIVAVKAYCFFKQSES
ncbi:hypothetical protein [Vibrio sonorensis]|uniref:hypothetical protein n=1 Tax=Vibrio sonorensis TaxID=1004316 RepID=UPI0008D91FB5|nr:hypothetical protein [Vibrio sonorensis]